MGAAVAASSPLSRRKVGGWSLWALSFFFSLPDSVKGGCTCPDNYRYCCKNGGSYDGSFPPVSPLYPFFSYAEEATFLTPVLSTQGIATQDPPQGLAQSRITRNTATLGCAITRGSAPKIQNS